MNVEWCIPPKQSAEFVCKMEDVLDIYKMPYNSNRPVICMDELSKQLVKETRVTIPMKQGSVEKYDTEYERNGVSNIFLYIEPLKGEFFTKVTERRTKIDWAYTIEELVDKKYPKVEKIILVLDNLNTHVGSSLYETFLPEKAKRLLDKIEFHYTPKHGSWLNIAEIGLSMLSRQCLSRRIPDKETIQREIAAWTTNINESQKNINWRFTTDDARIKLKRLYPTIEL